MNLIVWMQLVNVDNIFTQLNKQQRLQMLGARLWELETRNPCGYIEKEKWESCYMMFWQVMSDNVPEDDWIEFCGKDRMNKYLKVI